MKVTRIESPHQVKPVTTNESATKARAVEAFNKASQAAQAPVSPQQSQKPEAPIPVNPNQIAPEDMSAVTGQNRTSVDTSTPEPVIEQKQEVKQAQPSVSQEYQLLARKEKQLRQQAQQLAEQSKTKEQQWANEKAQLEARLAELEKNTISRQRLKEQTFDVLADEGISYDDVTQQAMDYSQKNPRYEAVIQKMQAKINQLEQRDQKRDAEAQEASKQQYNAAIKQIRTDAVNLIKADPNFEMIRATNSVNDIVELIEATYREDGRIMSVDEAAEEVEKYLEAEAVKLAQTGKVKKRLGSSNASNNQASETQQNMQSQQSKTLTNAASTTRKLSGRERAILAFKGELK